MRVRLPVLRRMRARWSVAAPRRRSTRLSPSEPFAEPCLLDWMRAVWSGNLAAEPRRRKDLAWIAQPLGIERAAHGQHDVEVVRREHLRHVFGLVGADAMFTGQRAAGVDAVLQ